MKKQRIVGLGFRARAGKDAVADALVAEFGAVKMAFAKPLKDACNIIFGWDDRHAYGELKEVVDPYWGFTPRWAYQMIGTQGVRDLIGKDTWVKSTKRKLDGIHQHIVFTDVRFPEEAALIRELGGECWHVWRPALGSLPADSHESEKAMAAFAWDRTIVNEETLQVLAALASLTWREGDREITVVGRSRRVHSGVEP